MGRVFKSLVFWAHTDEGRQRPQKARMQLDTGADRTILARPPPGGKKNGSGCINGVDVDLYEVIAFIPDTACNAKIEAAVPQKRGALPTVIGADFFQNTKAVLDYNGELIGCPRPRSKKAKAGFAGARRMERTGLLRFSRGKCKR